MRERVGYSVKRQQLVVALLVLAIAGCKKDEAAPSSDSTAPGQPTGIGVMDIDGNHYPIVTIGSQQWMKGNLRTANYSNGDPIPYVPSPISWASSSIGAWSYYSDDAAYNDVYGKLYNWNSVVDPRNICPTGWHVPTDDDWKALEIALGMTGTASNAFGWRGELSNIGGEMKYSLLWDSPNSGANNGSGFTAVPSGYRTQEGSYVALGSEGYWWSVSEHDPSLVWIRSLSATQAASGRFQRLRQQGLAVRCVKD